MRSLVLLLLFLALTIAGCRRETAAGVRLDPAFRRFVPADSRALAGIDFSALKPTPFYRRHEKQLNFPLLNSSAEQIGWDPRKDLAKALLAWDGKSLLITGQGKFDGDGLQKQFGNSGATRSQRDGFTMYSSGSEAFAFAAPDLALAGPPPALERALDGAKSGSGAIPAELSGKLRTLPAAAQLWAVSRGGLPFAEAPMQSEYASALSNIAGYVSGTEVSLIVADGLTLDARIQCVSEAGAKRVNDALRGVIGLGRLTARDDEPELLRLYDALHVTKEGTLVNLEAALSSELADALVARATKLSEQTR